MLTERRQKLQRYGFCYEAEGERRGETFYAKKYPGHHAEHLMVFINGRNSGVEKSTTFKELPSDANKTIAFLNAEVLDDSSRRQGYLTVLILVTGKTGLLERVTGSPMKADVQSQLFVGWMFV
jgi:hypothetical protein